ncbi:hypothetical protein DES39_0511 [Orbus hercynius]|uniref:Uncharacterized protein n=1 Tax=Orbus hercynius TaxID=593135 RepID=A0A495RIQ4_9GAMM|nr:hypothetical protein [Orbus hercynius]RKS87291.1 hypothetical protein DES39_0511 [Orbus hercynius]
MKLTNLNVGDSVTVFRLGKILRIEKIERKTKTMLVTKMGNKFNINTGYKIPYDTFSSSIQPTTEDDRKAVTRQEMIDKLMSFPFGRLSYEQLKNVLKAISGKEIK